MSLTINRQFTQADRPQSVRDIEAAVVSQPAPETDDAYLGAQDLLGQTISRALMFFGLVGGVIGFIALFFS